MSLDVDTERITSAPPEVKLPSSEDLRPPPSLGVELLDLEFERNASQQREEALAQAFRVALNEETREIILVPDSTFYNITNPPSAIRILNNIRESPSQDSGLSLEVGLGTSGLSFGGRITGDFNLQVNTFQPDSPTSAMVTYRPDNDNSSIQQVDLERIIPTIVYGKLNSALAQFKPREGSLTPTQIDNLFTTVQELIQEVQAIADLVIDYPEYVSGGELSEKAKATLVYSDEILRNHLIDENLSDDEIEIVEFIIYEYEEFMDYTFLDLRGEA